MLKLLVATLLATATSVTGCGPAEVQVTATVPAPHLVMVAPGVWVVENYDRAIYYSDGVYWQYIDGIWYRSPYYDSGFARVDVAIVPRVIVGAYRPSHIHYRPPAHVTRRPIVRPHHRRR